MPYKIVRFYQKAGKRKRTVKRGLTEKEAIAHCRDPKTSNVKEGWFDGYTQYKPRKKRRKR